MNQYQKKINLLVKNKLSLKTLLVISLITMALQYSAKAMDADQLVGCYRTLKVNGKNVKFKNNKSMIYYSDSMLYRNMQNKPIKSLIINLFKKKHADWTEWNSMDLFLEIGQRQDSSENHLAFQFSGRLRSYYNKKTTFSYQSNIEILKTEDHHFKIDLKYQYTSNSGFADRWAKIFEVIKIDDSECE